MNKNNLLFKVFIVLAIIQLAVPLYMIWRWENILQTGQQYTFVTAPIDPYDALRGRYVDLRFEEMQGPVLGNAQLIHGQTAYAVIAEDQEGHALISGISATRPEGNSYVKIRVAYIQEDNIAHFELPFKRYYMQEELAPRAEQAYQNSAGTEAVVLVRVKDGYGVVEQLYIGDKTIYEYLR